MATGYLVKRNEARIVASVRKRLLNILDTLLYGEYSFVTHLADLLVSIVCLQCISRVTVILLNKQIDLG